MLVELGVVEQRYRAVLEVLDEGASVIDVARRYGVARQTVHEWLRRYAEGGLGGLADRSSRPDSCPHQMPPAVEARVLWMRRVHPAWGPRGSCGSWSGPRAAAGPLQRLPGPGPPWLMRRASGAGGGRITGAGSGARSMELWQMDIMGRVFLAGGTEVKIVTGIDDHSRFMVCAKRCMRATARPVCQALTEALRRHGVPQQILTDIQDG